MGIEQTEFLVVQYIRLVVGFYIFDRWGEIVFESHDPLVGWDGTYGVVGNHSCQDGTYTWKLILSSEDGVIGGSKKKTYHGHVNLIK